MKTKTLVEQLRSKNLSTGTDIRSFLIGKRLKVMKCTCSHNYPIGSIITPDAGSSFTTTSVSSVARPDGSGYGNTINFTNLVLVETNTKKEIKEEIKSVEESIKEEKEKIKELKSKLDFLKVNKLESFDEDEFKVFQTLQTLSQSISDIEKAKIIAKLIKN